MKNIHGIATVLIVSLVLATFVVNAAELDRAIEFPGLEEIEFSYIEQTANVQDVMNYTASLYEDVEALSSIEDEEELIRASLEVGFLFEEHIGALNESKQAILALLEKTKRDYLANATKVEVDLGFNSTIKEEQLGFLGNQIGQSVEGLQDQEIELSMGTRRFLRDANQRFQERQAFTANQPEHLRTYRTEADVRGLLDSLANNLAWVEHHLFITEGLAR